MIYSVLGFRVLMVVYGGSKGGVSGAFLQSLMSSLPLPSKNLNFRRKCFHQPFLGTSIFKFARRSLCQSIFNFDCLTTCQLLTQPIFSLIPKLPWTASATA